MPGPRFFKVLFFLVLLGLLQVVIVTVSSQNGGIVNQIRRYTS